MFYIGTSYLMNVHFGSKDFHLSCFGFSFVKNPSLPHLLGFNKVRGYICLISLASNHIYMASSFQNEGFVCHQGFSLQVATPQSVATSQDIYSTKRKRMCVLNLCFAVLFLLYKKKKVWENIIYVYFGFPFRFVYRRLIN